MFMWSYISFALGIVFAAFVLPFTYSVVKSLLGIGPPGKVYSAPPIQEVIDAGGGEYSAIENQGPKLTGRLFAWFSNFLFTPFGEKWVLSKIMNDNRMFAGRERYLPEAATFYPTAPFVTLPDQTGGDGDRKDNRSNDEMIERVLHSDSLAASSSHDELGGEGRDFVFPSVMEYLRAYKCGDVTPEAVSERIIERIGASESLSPPLRAFVQWNESEIRKQAAESTRRYKEKDNIRPLEGVPFGVKEEFLASIYRPRNGASFLPICAQTLVRQGQESESVVRLSGAGAILVGMTNMPEIGVSSSGSNVNKLHGTARNPYHLDRYCGGSSSGSAAAVASGLVPLALGSDGGGSIRVPSSMCGIVGLKSTHGRISCSGTSFEGMTIATPGPMCTSVRDAVLSYLVMAGADPKYPMGLQQGPVAIGRYLTTGSKLSGIRIGVYNQWFDHSDTAVRKGCRVALTWLQEAGAEIVSIKIPELNQSREAHTVISLCELYSAYRYDLPQHFQSLNVETRVPLAIAAQFSAADYVAANRQRTRAIKTFEHLFKQVDIIATPSTACTAPPISPQADTHGEIDIENTLKLTRFTMQSNLTGVPAISIPVGYDSDGLPFSFQLMAAWWQEDILFQVASALEKRVKKRKPKLFYDVLGEF